MSADGMSRNAFAPRPVDRGARGAVSLMDR
jgi:hypothetical protein